MKLDQNEICDSYWKAAFYTVRKPHDYNTYTHQVLIKGVYYGKWGIPLTATKQYIDKLWKEKYSEYDSLDDFKFTRAELEYIYCLAKNDPFEIDKSYINGAFGNNANYEYIFKQRKKYFSCEGTNVLKEEIYSEERIKKEAAAFIENDKREFKLEDLCPKFISMFDKIYNNPSLLDDDNVTLVDDMQRYLDYCKNEWFEIKHENISNTHLDNMFFNLGAYPSDFVHMDDEEERMYDEFAVDCILNGNVEENIRKIIEKKELKGK